MDTQSRDLIESAYRRPGYQQPLADDFGYGDPGYSDPSYDGPSSYGSPRGNQQDHKDRFPFRRDAGGYGPGYQVPDPDDPAPGFDPVRAAWAGFRPAASPSEPDIYPVTGAQEALPDTGSQPAAWGKPIQPGYPEQWYEHPRLDVPQASDPRLEGMRYDELRYDDEPGNGGYEEPLDDDSWYEELRRSAPVYPQQPTFQPAPGTQAQPGQPQPTQAQPQPGRRGEPGPAQRPGSGFGAQPGYSQPGSAQPGCSQPQAPGWGGQGPQLNAGRSAGDTGRGFGDLGRGPADTARPGTSAWSAESARPGDPARPGDGRMQGPAAPGAGYLAAPAAQVGLLTPPAGSRIGTLPDSDPFDGAPTATQFLATPQSPAQALSAPDLSAPDLLAPPIRPGHGLDGPEITSSWPTQPQTDERAFEEFWREADDGSGEYTGLFGDEDTGPRKRAVGRRRGRSNDHRLWLALGGVVVVAAGAITGIIKFEFPSHGGPAHTMSTPAKIGTYVRTANLERETDVAQLRNEVIKMSAGQATKVVSAVYEAGNSAAGNNEQIVMFIGGHLANAAPATSITSFTEKFPGAKVVSAGALGGKAACVEEGTSTDAVSMCAWFDNDSFGEIVSPTMNAQALAPQMLIIRPAVEHVVQK